MIDTIASPILKAGRNCWRIERAARFALLVDADPYFRAVRHAILSARHSIYILSWDINSRMRLVPSGAGDGWPEELGDFLHAVISARENLHAYVLNWDFAMLYAMEREWLPVYKLGWRTHSRLSFKMDHMHPAGASHHQKIIVVDDSIAFVGGLDLTRQRWDTPAHRLNDPDRIDINGRPYDPFHDVQAAVEGPVARALGDLCRLRWQRIENVIQPKSAQSAGKSFWPPWLLPDLTDIDVGICRTEPAYEGRPGASEIRLLHLDAIAAARHSLFFENQYFTSQLIADALSLRLAEQNGPEVLVISPLNQSGWLEESTMGVLRARLQRRLRRADRFDRYRLMCPLIPNQDHGCLNVHSKVFAMDETLFSVGSANLSNRSMGFDTECNLAIEASGDDIQNIKVGIARMRSRLLAEHLDHSVEEVMQASTIHGNLLGSIVALANRERRLQSFEPVALPELEALIPEQALFDPERPIDPERLVTQLFPEEERAPLPRRMLGLAALTLMLTGLTLAWQFTPLRTWLNISSLVALASEIEQLPFTPFLVMLAYIVGGLLMVPVTLLIAVTGIVFGTIPGALYAMAGAMLSAATGFGLGAWLGRATVQKILGGRINRLSHRIARRGILTVAIVRLLPLAPFSVVNIVAGASGIALRDYLIGTMLGLAPGILLTTAFAHNLMLAFQKPSTETLAVLLIVVLLLIGFALYTKKILERHKD